MKFRALYRLLKENFQIVSRRSEVRASQLHKLNVRGETSDFRYAAFLKSLNQHGTDTADATIEVTGFGNIGDSLDATVNIGAADLNSSYVVVAAAEGRTVMATGLAAAINAQTDVTAVAVSNVVQILKSTAGSVEVVTTAVV